ncbi:unnamed protein product [Candidula unifasciata]|uniref:G-protein coupled receptors family 1 profile domain-containing protein n=1 Tax=Candidula unifasciata TaxID=100452 RepID=A0A8S3ZKQ8_9EUPU|nr:unnamed protein product [Candidula unifasciata]
MEGENQSLVIVCNNGSVLPFNRSDAGEDNFYTELSTAETATIGFLLVAIFFTSLFVNTFVILVFWKRRTLTISNRFVANLTICNCLNTLVVVPCAFTSLLTQRWVFGMFWCVSTGFIMNVVVSASIFTLAVISIDRYCAVVTPLHYSMKMTSRRCYVFVICIWVTAVFISAPPLLGWNAIEFQRNKMVCTVKWSGAGRYDSCYTYFLIMFSFVLPLIAIMWTYCRIYRAARGNIVRARRNSIIRVSPPATAGQSDESVQQSTPVNSRRRSSTVPILRRLSQSSSRSSSFLWRKEEWKAAVTSFLVLFSFAICWAPYFLVMAVEAGCSTHCQPYPIISHISTVLAMLSCACNPLLYVFRSKLVRRELTDVVRGRTSREHSVCIPHEVMRRNSVVRTDSCRSLPSLMGLREEEEVDDADDNFRDKHRPGVYSPVSHDRSICTESVAASTYLAYTTCISLKIS